MTSIRGDADGVVVVREDFVGDVLRRLEKLRDSVSGYEQNVKRGVFSNEWVDVALRDAGCTLRRYPVARLRAVSDAHCSVTNSGTP